MARTNNDASTTVQTNTGGQVFQYEYVQDKYKMMEDESNAPQTLDVPPNGELNRETPGRRPDIVPVGVTDGEPNRVLDRGPDVF